MGDEGEGEWLGFSRVTCDVLIHQVDRELPDTTTTAAMADAVRLYVAEERTARGRRRERARVC